MTIIKGQGIETLKLLQIDLTNGLMTEQDVKDSISGSGFKPNGITRESLTHFERFSFKRDLSLLDFAHRNSRIIFDGWQAFWKQAQTYFVTRGRHFKPQSVVRTNEIVLSAWLRWQFAKTISDLAFMPTCQNSSIAVSFNLNNMRKVCHTLPRRLQSALRLARLDKIRVLDAPSGDGTYLRCFGPGSVGLELQEQLVMNGRANDLDMRQCNLEEDEDWRVEETFPLLWH